MGKKQSSRDSSSSRRQWQRIFGALVEMLQSQQTQIETLKNDRELLERYVHIQHDRWAAKARLLESHIAQTKTDEKKGRRVQAAKLDLMVGMKQREALCYKKQAELAESDLEDFRACVEALNGEISELKEGRSGVGDLKPTGNPKDGEKSAVAFKGELQKLKHAYKKLSLEKEAEFSSLLAEKDFVWNQFKKMESDYTAIVKSMRVEVEQSNETINKLQRSLENLQSSANEKNEMIAKLEAERVRLDLDLRRLTEEAKQANGKIEKLLRDMDELRLTAKEKDETIANLRSDLAKMDATECTNQKSRFYREVSSQKSSRSASGSRPRRSSRKRSSESAESGESQKHRRSHEDSSGLRTSGSVNGLQRCSRGKKSRINSSVDSPKLFSANFKVPKLRSLSSAIV